jgi:hypothetical protein
MSAASEVAKQALASTRRNHHASTTNNAQLASIGLSEHAWARTLPVSHSHRLARCTVAACPALLLRIEARLLSRPYSARDEIDECNFFRRAKPLGSPAVLIRQGARQRPRI